MLILVLQLLHGKQWLSVSDLFTWIKGDSEGNKGLVLTYRLYRFLVAVFAGGIIGVCGQLMQVLFRNDLAGPSVLGVTSGASFGVALSVFGTVAFGISFGQLSLSVGAMIGAFISLAIILLVFQRLQNIASVLIIGLLVGYFLSAIVNVLVIYGLPEEVKRYSTWGMGSLNNAKLTDIWVLLGVGTSLTIFVLKNAKKLDILSLGGTVARSMGVEVKRLSFYVLLVVAIGVGLITSFYGPIAFIGIIVPYFARQWSRSSQNKDVLVLSFMLGAVVLAMGDLFAHYPKILPLNTVISIMAIPGLFFIILKKRAYVGG